MNKSFIHTLQTKSSAVRALALIPQKTPNFDNDNNCVFNLAVRGKIFKGHAMSKYYIILCVMYGVSIGNTYLYIFKKFLFFCTGGKNHVTTMQ